MDCIFVKVKDKTITLKEFLEMDDSVLNSAEGKIKKALAYLYEKNDKEPPLFKEFPDRGEKKLTIDCTTIPLDNALAHYVGDDNVIEFTSSTEIVDLISTLAHELKHAEQFSQECLSLYKNHTKAQQIDFIVEAQAYAFDAYISSLVKKDGIDEITLSKEDKEEKKDDDDEEYEDEYDDDVLYDDEFEDDEDEEDENDDEFALWGESLAVVNTAYCNQPNMDDKLEYILQRHQEKEKFEYSEYEKEAIAAILPMLYTGVCRPSYKGKMDRDYKINGIKPKEQLDHIPSSFHLSKETEKELLPVVAKIPPTNITESSKDYLFRYLLCCAATGDYYSIWECYDEAIRSKERGRYSALYYLQEAFENGQEYIADRMIEDHKEDELNIFFAEDEYGTPCFEPSDKIKHAYLTYSLNEEKSYALDYPCLQDKNLINQVFSEINLSIQTVDKKDKTVSDQSLSVVDKKVSEKITYFMEKIKEQGICEIEPEGKLDKLKEAIQYGHVETTKVLLDSLKESNADEVNKVFSDISSNWKRRKKLPATQQEYISKNSKEILAVFLDLKDEKGNFIIKKEALEQLIGHANTETLKSLTDYQQKNPEDKRFAGIQIPSKKRAGSKTLRDRLSAMVSYSEEPQNKVEQLIAKKKADIPHQGLVALLDALNKEPATQERKAAKEALVKTYRKEPPKAGERE